MEEKSFALELTLHEGYRFSVDFLQDGVPELLTDEPPPLGEGAGPNPARLLGAAVGSCLGSSLLFCLRKAHVEVDGLRTTVEGTLVRNERGRLRIGELRVRLEPEADPEQVARMGRCLELFDDFCIVGQSVREGIDLKIEVAPVAVEAAAMG